VKFLPIFIITAFLTAATLALAESTLPAWHDKERAKLEADGWVAGAALLSADPVPGEAAPLARDTIQFEPPKPEEIAGDLKSLPAIAEKFLPAYFAARPKNFLIDPQGLLSPADYSDRLGFLNYHASDSAIDLFVYVIGGDQEIPSEVREEEVPERFFTEGRAALIAYYYLGAPQRSVVYLSPSIIGSISAAEQHRTLESAVLRAIENNKPTEQFEKFLSQMSIRIYWMERMLAGKPVAAALPFTATASPAAAAKSAKLRWLQSLALQFATPAAVFLGILLTFFVFTRWLRHSARYRFPEFEVEPRLGGAHAAGVGAVISFASSAVPPASQRDQVPDYLRRV
jgi:hypothetical protein